MKDVEVIKAHNTLSPRARTNFEKRLRVAAYCRVSTDTEDQLNSYKSQVKYYTELIKSKPEWSLAGIYADEAITGTQVKKREDFQRLINDCMNGDVDMVITKSISRFARNTLDTLKYVRMLKDKGVAVFFEEENINTLTMDGELLLVILSSVAQQEVENISANVKKGLKMKMQRGELVGFQGCLGYAIAPKRPSSTAKRAKASPGITLKHWKSSRTYEGKRKTDDGEKTDEIFILAWIRTKTRQLGQSNKRNEGLGQQRQLESGRDAGRKSSHLWGAVYCILRRVRQGK